MRGRRLPVPRVYDSLRRRVRRYAVERGALRRLRHAVRDQSGLQSGHVHGGVFRHSRELRAGVREPVGRYEQLRRVRCSLRGWPGVQREYLRVPARHDDVRRSLRRDVDRPEQLRRVRHDVHGEPGLSARHLLGDVRAGSHTLRIELREHGDR